MVKDMKDAQKYRRANARGAGPEAEGKAKIRAAAKIEKKAGPYSSESTIYGLRSKGAENLGEAYSRKIGGKANAYSKGGLVKKPSLSKKGK